MGHKLVEQLLPALEKMSWPGSDEATPQGRMSYQVGREKVDSYRNDPKVLAEALRIFQSGQSRPFAYAGAAYTLLAAAREPEGGHARNGLEAATAWLERAQALAPNELDINIIEALIYVYNGRFDDALTVLDYLRTLAFESQFLLRAEIAYHQGRGEVEEAIAGYELAIERARTPPQRLDLQHELADCYLEFGRLKEALDIYEELIHFDDGNPLLWHKMSAIQYRLGDYQAAARHNQQALEHGPIPEAEQMNDALRRKLGTGILRRLFGR